MTNSKRFLDIEPQFYSYEQANFVVIPVPYEKTTSYGHGTRRGPAAILNASQQVENYDDELGFETYRRAGIYTLKASPISALGLRVKQTLDDSKIPVVLGGEHSITPVIVKPLAEKYSDLSVLQLDAHADLRDTYQGRKDSHATTMRRVLEICPAVQIGIRSLSLDEAEWAKLTGQIGKIHFAKKLEIVEKIENQLSNNVYITIDVDVFDPAAVPAVGTPEPGGLLWYELLDILKGVCTTKNVVGFDVVELAPRHGDLASDFTVAKLVYKLMGLMAAK